MPTNPKKARFSKVKAVKGNSRDRIGPVPATKVVPHKKKQKLEKEIYSDELPDNDVRFGESPDY